MLNLLNPFIFPQAILTLEDLNYFEKWLLGYFFYWGIQSSVSKFKIYQVAEDFNEDESKIVKAVRKLERLGYLNAKYTTSVNGVEEISLSINIKSIY